MDVHHFTHKQKTVQVKLLHDIFGSSIPHVINLGYVYSINKIKNPHNDKQAELKITLGGKQRGYFCCRD